LVNSRTSWTGCGVTVSANRGPAAAVPAVATEGLGWEDGQPAAFVTSKANLAGRGVSPLTPLYVQRKGEPGGPRVIFQVKWSVFSEKINLNLR
jgi:hypothetical protein